MTTSGSLEFNVAVPDFVLEYIGEEIGGITLTAPVVVPEIESRGVYGGVSMRLASPTLEVATKGTKGSLNITVKAPSLAVESRQVYGSVSINLKVPVLTLASKQVYGALSITARPPVFAIGSGKPVSGSLEVSIKAPSLELYGYSERVGSLVANLAVPLVTIGGLYNEYSVVSINTDVMAITEYSNYDFTAFARVDDDVYGLNSDGNIYLLGGISDNEYDINASFSVMKSDFGVDKLKRLLAAVFGFKSTAELSYHVERDLESGEDISIGSNGDNLTEVRKVGSEKLKPTRTIGVTVSNIDGCDFTIDSIELPFRVTPMRRF